MIADIRWCHCVGSGSDAFNQLVRVEAGKNLKTISSPQRCPFRTTVPSFSRTSHPHSTQPRAQPNYLAIHMNVLPELPVYRQKRWKQSRRPRVRGEGAVVVNDLPRTRG